jgi:hypothetical protein
MYDIWDHHGGIYEDGIPCILIYIYQPFEGNSFLHVPEDKGSRFLP